MRTVRVVTNDTCNQNCAFCDRRRASENRQFVAPAAVRTRIDQALASGDELILTGGEPTLRRDLAELVAYARAQGAQRVTLETNAALVDDDLATALARAGLDSARVHLPAWGEALDEVTRDPGGWESADRGIAAFGRARIAVEASAPVIKSNIAEIADLPRVLVEAIEGPLQALVLAVPTQAADPSELVPMADAAAAIEAAEANARHVGLALRLEADGLIPPCLFSRPGRLAHLYTLTPGGRDRDGWRQLPECSECVAADRCPGFPELALAREPQLRARPIADDQVRRRLSVISTMQEQIDRELYQDDIYRRDGGVSIPARIVRINFRCNQACHFCFVSTHLPTAEDRAVEDAIVAISRQRGVLVLSGGEPTLNPRLLEYVALGKREGASEIELQTNAMNLATDGLAQRLADAGVDQAFISLHGSRAEISDVVTDAPGTFSKTVAGIDAVVKTHMRTRLNFVFCQANHADFPAYVEMVARRWPQVAIVVSFVAGSTDVVPRTADLIPRYSDVLPYLAEGIRAAERLSVPITGFESMCGIPLCLVPADVLRYFELAEVPPDFDRGEFVETDACTRCDLLGRCFGVRRGYLDLHGPGEFHPVTRTDAL